MSATPKTSHCARSRYIDWMDQLTATRGREPRLSPVPIEDRQSSVATVVARLAFQELDVDHEGLLSRKYLQRAFKHNDRFREFMMPLLSLPGFVTLQTTPEKQWDRIVVALEGALLPADDGGSDDVVYESSFVAFFEAVSFESMQSLSPPRRPSPRRMRTDAFVRKRTNPGEPATLWELPTARGEEPIGFVPLRGAQSLPRLPIRAPLSPLRSPSPPPPVVLAASSDCRAAHLPPIQSSNSPIVMQGGRASPSTLQRAWR